MRVRNMLLEEIKTLDPQHVIKVYDLVLILKHEETAKEKTNETKGYLLVQNALKNCPGSFSADISMEREERV